MVTVMIAAIVALLFGPRNDATVMAQSNAHPLNTETAASDAGFVSDDDLQRLVRILQGQDDTAANGGELESGSANDPEQEVPSRPCADHPGTEPREARNSTERALDEWARDLRGAGHGVAEVLARDVPAHSAQQPGGSAQEPLPMLVSPHDRERLRQVAYARRARDQGEDYVIGSDDLLEITIPDLSGEPAGGPLPVDAEVTPVASAPTYRQGLRVSGSGVITLPLIGSVHAAGRTPRELEQFIERGLIDGGLLRRPEVRVFVVEYRSRAVSVIGEVQRPGLYPLIGQAATISDMLWVAGGPTVNAGRIIEFAPAAARGTGGGAPPGEPIRMDLEILMQRRGDGANDPLARAGDVVNVPPAGTVNVDGWVTTPGSYPITRNLTVAGAIAAAGGHLFPAKLGAVEILRTFGTGQQERIRVNMAAVKDGEANDVPVKDGDVVHVPKSLVRLLPWSAWHTAVSLVRIGGSVVLF
jgi:polysaccharide export outer membrane protein